MLARTRRLSNVNSLRIFLSPHKILFEFGYDI
jgi:hypothetical protein